MLRGARSMVVVTLVALCGCPQLPPLRVAYEGCELYTDEPVAFSEALPREHCVFGDRLTASLGLSMQPVLRYGLGEDSAEGNCAPGVGACARPGLVISGQPHHLHELVHATLGNLGLIGTRALQEGAASLFGCGTDFDDWEVYPDLPVSLLYDAGAFYEAGDGYARAMSFVSFLIDREGEATFVELLAHTDDETRRLGLDSLFLDLYGNEASHLLAQWNALGPQPAYRLCRRVYECAAPEWSGEETLVLDRGVADDVAHGGAIRTITVDREATLRIRADVLGADVRVLSCDRGPDVVPEAGHWSAADDSAPIGPGRYAVWVTGLIAEGDQSHVEAEVAITIE